MDQLRFNPSEVQDLVINTMQGITEEFEAQDPNTAESLFDWCVQELIDHTYYSAAWGIIDFYKTQRYLYDIGEL